MKQLKFLKTISCDGRPIWYKDCYYDVKSMGANSQGREMYKLFCEDLQFRGIDVALADKFYKVIELEDKKEVKGDIIITEQPKTSLDKLINECKNEVKKVSQQPKKSTQNNQKSKKSSK